MSGINQPLLGNQQAITNYDVSKLFILNNRYEQDNELNNSSYGPWVLPIGTVMGRIASTGQVTPCISGALDGSQFPIGVLAHNVSIAAGATIQVTICIAGDLAQEKLVFIGGDSVSTVIAGRSMRDHLQLYGLLLRSGTEMTDYDNQ